MWFGMSLDIRLKSVAYVYIFVTLRESKSELRTNQADCMLIL